VAALARIIRLNSDRRLLTCCGVLDSLLGKVVVRRVSVLVGDDQPLFRDALARVIRQCPRFELVAEVADGPAALSAIEEHRPDVAVVSLALPWLDGERVLNAVVRDGMSTRVLLLAGPADEAVAYRAIERGAAGCIGRHASAEQLAEAIATTARGGAFVSGELHDGLAREIRLRSRDERPVLTERERQILRLKADGAGNRTIAHTLHVSLPTVKTHVRHLYEKLGTSDRAAAVATAMRRGLLE
jgi:two-component system, NarL family, nitrate/nitrite response regulator NarL